MSCEAAGAENKRKRQESIQGAEILDNVDSSTPTSPSADNQSEKSVEDQQQQQEEEGSSPAKRPRTSEDGNEESDDESQEPSVIVEVEAKLPKPTKPSEISNAPVFGMSFANSRGLSGFAAAAKVATPFSTFSGAGATSGFAKYASATSPTAATAVEAEAAKEKEEEKEEKTGEGSKCGKTFEDMLTAEGKESLATNAAMSVMVPAMAHTNVSEQVAAPIRTYEEDEKCLYTTKAKLFELSGEDWKERGSGQFKVNQHKDNPLCCRLVMRTDQTFRLILNAPLFAGMRLGCERRFVRLTCVDPETMAPVTFALRFASESIAAQAHDHISNSIPPANAAPEDAKGKADKGKAADTANASDSESEDEDYEDSTDESDVDDSVSEEEFDTEDDQEDDVENPEDTKAGASSSLTEKSPSKQPE
ncbi:PH domain-like protein [Coemansia reversa NRRL 1564]|uniref:PH domain-like protein n=1 Tax=Coemansia reversa (strain ATCC 12441 / NRRL 1564) TaxID=763665 RepID=A0A2G5B663_COERN|nr:PH domain-like protein [Coemansia reversa NRRL 1564]|eukprot:PIA14533.1 PH domain-like protein [Coemansia reversa NRRL 1564]